MKRIVTITGASGAGKDSILDAVMFCYGCKAADELKGISCSVADATVLHYDDVKLRELVSHTTRQPREGEVNGVDYYYITEDEFGGIEKIESTEYAGNHYCLAVSEVDKLTDDELGIVIVDQHGVSCIEAFADARNDVELFKIFIKLDSATSEARMQGRGDKADRIAARLEQQREKNEYAPNVDNYNLVLEGTDAFIDNVIIVCEALNAFAKGEI